MIQTEGDLPHCNVIGTDGWAGSFLAPDILLVTRRPQNTAVILRNGPVSPKAGKRALVLASEPMRLSFVAHLCSNLPDAKTKPVPQFDEHEVKKSVSLHHRTLLPMKLSPEERHAEQETL